MNAAFSLPDGFLERGEEVIAALSGTLSGTELARFVEGLPERLPGQAPVRRLASCSIELAQNIRLHGLGGTGTLAVLRYSDGFRIRTRNRADLERALIVMERVAAIRGSSATELRARIRDRRNRPLAPGARSPGLGLLEVARRSACRLDCSLIPFQDFQCHLVLCASFSRTAHE